MTILDWIAFAGIVLFCIIMLYAVIFSIIIILTKNDDE